MWYINSALRKLPDCQCRVFRGSDDIEVVSKYKLGTEITWSGFTSCSTKESVAKSFAKNSGLLFVIEVANGKSIMPFSAIPAEEEVLLPPNATLMVSKVKTSNDANMPTTIHLVEKSGSFKW